MTEDAHRRTAALMLQKEPAEVTDAERRYGRTLNAAFATAVPPESFIPAFQGAARVIHGPEQSDDEARQQYLLFCQRVLGMTHPELEDQQLWEELDGWPQP
jgi:hypothetical protein